MSIKQYQCKNQKNKRTQCQYSSYKFQGASWSSRDDVRSDLIPVKNKLSHKLASKMKENKQINKTDARIY